MLGPFNWPIIGRSSWVIILWFKWLTGSASRSISADGAEATSSKEGRFERTEFYLTATQLSLHIK